MAEWKLCLVLLLPLTVFFKEVTAETIEKTIGSKPDVTPVCTNSTTSIITLVTCKIRTERNREGCRLLYQHGPDFENVTDSKCDSRFKLMMDNYTVYLHLMKLLPVDSGNYSCQCVHPDGVYTLLLNITVEENKDASGSTNELILFALIGVAVVIIIAGVFLKLIHRRIRHGKRSKPVNTCPDSGPGDIEPYSTFTRKESGLYSTTRVQFSNSNTSNSNVSTRENSQAGHLLQSSIHT